MDWIEILVTGGVIGGVFTIAGKFIDFILERTGKKKDKTDDIKAALMVILLDRILYLGRSYIAAGKVDADDRRRFIEMHDIYKKLGGNGDADDIMCQVKNLRFI